ncbi:MAG: NAD-dependent epimerase/dehydratase family protein [Acidimicrobiia bacterium]
MAKIMVTGATGLIGSRIAHQLVDGGHDVVALVRPTTDATALERLGITIAPGDITDRTSVDAALRGCDGVIHSAAIVGVPNQQLDSSRAANLGGTENVVDAARAAGVPRTVCISTAAVFDRGDGPMTERSPVATQSTSDPYTVTKIEAYVAAKQRLDAGQDIVFVLPGATFGPSPMGERMINIPGGNQRLARALRSEPAVYPPMKAPWSYTGHVADVTIAALERGTTGDNYIAYGALDCVALIAEFVNRACELAGIEYRAGSVPVERLDDPEVVAMFGPTLVEVAKKPSPDPYFDASYTHAHLGITPRSLDENLLSTLAWLRDGLV